MNDQSTRDCAWGDTATCTLDILGKSAGWPRFTAGPPAGKEHGQWPEGHSNETTRSSKECPSNPVDETVDCGSSGPRNSSFNDDTDVGHPPVKGDPEKDVEYRLHEFGLLSPLHAWTHWPGFSLNPALWDLARLDTSYRRTHGRQFKFDPTDIRSAQLVRSEASSYDRDRTLVYTKSSRSGPSSFAVRWVQ